MCWADTALTGRFFDAFGLSQLRPEVALMYPRPNLHHLRNEAGRREVDLVLDLGAGRVVALEFKAGAAPDAHDATARVLAARSTRGRPHRLRYRLIAVQSEFLGLLRASCPRVRPTGLCTTARSRPVATGHISWITSPS